MIRNIYYICARVLFGCKMGVIMSPIHATPSFESNFHGDDTFLFVNW